MAPNVLISPPVTTINVVPEQFRKLVGEEAPYKARHSVASGILPMPSEALVPSLCFLGANDPDKAVQDAAKSSLAGLDPHILANMAKATNDPGVLHQLSSCMPDNENVVAAVLTNRWVHNETLRVFASSGKGASLKIVAHNQVRLMEYPAIVEALYFNPETPMATVVSALETCVHQKIDISFIPGHEEIIESIIGVRADKKPDPISKEAEEENAQDGEEAGAEQDGIAQEDFQELLKSVNADTEDESRKALTWKAITEMSVAQKVRLAIVGNQTARKVLIRDSRRVVAVAVLRSPRLTDKEIAAFAKNRALPDFVIRSIASKREWVKHTEVKRGLVQNPKCPPQLALRFLPALNERDLKSLANNKEVPTYIMQAAKRLFNIRQTRRSGGARQR